MPTIVRHALFLLLFAVLVGCASSPGPAPSATAAQTQGQAPEQIAERYQEEMGVFADNYPMERSRWSLNSTMEDPYQALRSGSHLAHEYLRASLKAPEQLDERFTPLWQMHLATANTYFMTGQWEHAAVGYNATREAMDKVTPHLSSPDHLALAKKLDAYALEHFQIARDQRR